MENSVSETRTSDVSSFSLPARYWLAGTAGLLVTLVTAWFSFTMLEAGIASYRAERYLTYWETLEQAPPASARTKAKEAALQATEVFPVANGEYLDRLGRIYAWNKGAAPAHDDMIAARMAFDESLEARPDWPWTWVRMVYAKLQLKEVDDQLSQALRRAIDTGGGHHEIDKDLAQMGLRAWPELSISERALMLEAAVRSATFSEKDARSIYAVAQSTGQTLALCLSLTASMKTRQHICQEALQ
jgi:hypothetical protein